MRLPVAALVLIASMALPCQALGAFPGDNGKLAVVDNSPPGCTSGCERDMLAVQGVFVP
jgi:hypothetical protein